jgi:acetylornithine/succinyldiaminopimelate/putrescine aminotransferase
LTTRQLFLQHVAQTSEFPLCLEIERAEGVFIYDKQGKSYLDLISGIGVSNVGHRHPQVLAAIQQQLDQYLHLMVYGEYIQSPQVRLAQALAEQLTTLHTRMSAQSPLLVPPINQIYFTNSGTEAIEGAMKLAKRYTGRTEIISCFNAYHGASQGALSLSGSENFKQQFRPLLPDIRQINHGYLSDLEKITKKTSAVIIEVVSAEAGIRLAPAGYFEALRRRCDEVGALLVFDEIQTGFGRTGTFWAFEGVSTYPDVLVAAKGMGGGMPIGAFMANEERLGVFKNNPILGHITTFGGHPVSCAASLATFQVILEEKLVEKVAAKAELFVQLLQHQSIREVRQAGLLMALEFQDFDELKPIIDACINRGLITDWFLFCDNSMRIAPPLTISEAEIEQACAIILEVLSV